MTITLPISGPVEKEPPSQNRVVTGSVALGCYMVDEDVENGGNNCGNCRFMCQVTKKPRKNQQVVYGECRRFPPVRETVMEYAKDAPAMPIGWHWPHVHSGQWCGEHQERSM